MPDVAVEMLKRVLKCRFVNVHPAKLGHQQEGEGRSSGSIEVPGAGAIGETRVTTTAPSARIHQIPQVICSLLDQVKGIGVTCLQVVFAHSESAHPIAPGVSAKGTCVCDPVCDHRKVGGVTRREQEDDGSCIGR